MFERQTDADADPCSTMAAWAAEDQHTITRLQAHYGPDIADRYARWMADEQAARLDQAATTRPAAELSARKHFLARRLGSVTGFFIS